MKYSRLPLAIIVLVLIMLILPGCVGQPTAPEPIMPPPESEIETPPTSEYVTGEPQYTADLTGSGTASASTEGNWDPPSAVFDNDPSTYWQVSDSDTEWLVYNFRAAVIISKYSITTYGNPSAMPSSFILQGSNEAGNWTTLDVRDDVVPAWSISYTFDNSYHYRFYRLASICRQPNVAQFIIEEMELCSLVSDYEPLPPSEDWVWSEAAGKNIRKEDGTWIWSGFHHEWENTSHIFHDLQSEYYDIQYDFGPTTGKSELTGNLFGKQTIPKSDKLEYYTIKRGIKTGVAEFRYGSIEATVSGALGEHVEMVFPQEISLDGLGTYDNVTMFMRGFSFEEFGSQLQSGKGNYPIQCLGLWVSDIQQIGSVLRLNFTVMLHITETEFTMFPKPDPWQYKVTYYYTLVGGNHDEFTFTHGDKSYPGEYVGNNSHECLRVPDEERQITIQGDTGYNMGISVFRGFSIQINHNKSGLSNPDSRWTGRQIRVLDVAVPWQGYSSQTGKAFFTPDIYFCNKALVHSEMTTEYEGFFTLLQFQDPDQWDMTIEIRDAGNGEIEGMAGKADNHEYSDNLEPFSFLTP